MRLLKISIVLTSLFVSVSPVFAVPITVTITQTTPLDFAMTVASAGPFGGQRTATNGVGNWTFDFTVNEMARVTPPGPNQSTRDILQVNGNITHNVRPPGPEHMLDGPQGDPLLFGFSVDATNPSNPQPLTIQGSTFRLSGQENHPSQGHGDTFATSNLTIITAPGFRIDSWNFRVEAHHIVPEPSTLVLVTLGLAALGWRRWRRINAFTILPHELQGVRRGVS